MSQVAISAKFAQRGNSHRAGLFRNRYRWLFSTVSDWKAFYWKKCTNINFLFPLKTYFVPVPGSRESMSPIEFPRERVNPHGSSDVISHSHVHIAWAPSAQCRRCQSAIAVWALERTFASRIRCIVGQASKEARSAAHLRSRSLRHWACGNAVRARLN